MGNNTKNIVIKAILGKDIANYVECVLNIRLCAFEDRSSWYTGDMEKEREYIRSYSDSEEAILTLACDGEIVAGFLIWAPLLKYSGLDHTNISEALSELPLNDFYHCGEAVILQQYRSSGVVHDCIASKLLAATEEMLREQNRYKHLCFIMGIEDTNKLPNTKDTDYNPGRKRMGFTQNRITIKYRWSFLEAAGEIKQIEKEMSFWTKDLPDKQSEIEQ